MIETPDVLPRTRTVGPVPFSNAAAYRNDDVDTLFDQAQRIIDRDERAKTYLQIQEQVVEDQPYVWVVETSGTRAYRLPCTGFTPYAQFAESTTCAP